MTIAFRTRLWPCFALLATSVWAGGDSPGNTHKHTNRLIDSISPYLLQHAHNPVNWYPWGDEAFELAQREDKPIFLSIGYAACHWCHVMAHESFENEAIAAVLNKHFISIKVDREERPDIDEVYMAATTAKTGRGGWPMSVFMTTDKKPFMCGTYFPPEDGRGRRGFRGLCQEIAGRWDSDREALLLEAQELVNKVAGRKRIAPGRGIVERRLLSARVSFLASSFDPVLGGRRSRRNKFPPTFAMELMLREYVTQKEISKPQLIEQVETTLVQMARGGIYDHIGGGICRYSTDPRWFAPHFEKMLYDQATVSGVYLSAYQLTHDERFAETARGILDYCLYDLQSPEGGFYSSRDADSEGHEGKFYVWTKQQLADLLEPSDLALLMAYYNVKPNGNWEHSQNILHVKTSDEAFAKEHDLTRDEWRARLAPMKKKLFDARAKRIHPGLDDKILTEWNGLLITSLARAYRILDEPRYRDAATRAADFILNTMRTDSGLFRAHRRGVTHVPGNAADYASMIEALITLYETTGQHRWLNAAEKLNDAMIEQFHDATGGGFFYTANDAERLIVRSKNARDSVVPSANSTAVSNLLRLAVLLGRKDLRELAEGTLRTFERMLGSGGLERMQSALIWYRVPPKEIAIVGAVGSDETEALLREVYRKYLPNKVVAVSTPEDAALETAIPLLRRKTLVRGKAGAYVCRNYLCGRPVNDPTELAKLLEASP